MQSAVAEVDRNNNNGKIQGHHSHRGRDRRESIEDEDPDLKHVE